MNASQSLANVVAQASPPPVGGAVPALYLPTILSFVAILIAAMQGTLVLESTYPCRISIAKLVLLLFFEGLEVGIVLASEILTYIGLTDALKRRITWLWWTPFWVLVIGILQLVLDSLFTIDLAVESRVNYRPISCRSNDSVVWEIIMFFVTLALSLLLVGWRQRWWWDAPAVPKDVAERAVRNEVALSNATLIGVIGFAFVLLVSVFLYIVVGEIRSLRTNASLIRRARHVFASDRWAHAVSEKAPPKRQPSDELMEHYRMIAKVSPGEGESVVAVDSLPDADVKAHLEREPLRIGNMVVGGDVPHVLCKRNDVWAKAHRLFLFFENLVIVPLMISVVVAVARLHEELDELTFDALKELSEVVIVVAFLDLAITIKNILWNYSEKKAYVPNPGPPGQGSTSNTSNVDPDAKAGIVPQP